MQKTNLQVAKLVGAPDTSWSQVHTFSPPEEEKLQKRGELVAVLSAAGLGEGVEAVAAGREILSRLHEEYFGNLETGPYDRLKEAVSKIGEEFSSQGKITIIALVSWENVVYLAVLGDGKAMILRDGNLSRLAEGKEGETVTVSGFAKEGDLFLLATNKLFELAGEGVIRAALEAGTPEEAMDSLAPLIHQSPQQSLVGAAVVKVSSVQAASVFEPEEVEEKKEVSPAFSVLNSLGKFVQKLPRRPIYIRGEEGGRKTALSVGVILLLLLLISIVFGLRQRRILSIRQTYEGRLFEAEQKFNEAQNLKDLNPVRARQLISEARLIAEELSQEGVKDKRFEELQKNLGEVLGSVLGEYSVEGQLFLDLSLVRDGLFGDSMISSQKEILVFDKAGKRLVSFTFDSKDTKVLAGEEVVGEANLAAFYSGRAFLLDSEKIVEIDKEGLKKTVVSGEDEWGEIIFFEAYAGNLYLFDRGKGEIWRYPGVESGFGGRQRWFGKGVTSDFADAVSAAIDGSIWILYSSGKIAKYMLGAPDAFGAAGLSQEFSKPIVIFTNDQLENLYVLDAGNNRVVVLDKSGEYKAAYIWNKIGQARDFVVSEEEGKILLLLGDKIYEIKLQ